MSHVKKYRERLAAAFFWRFWQRGAAALVVIPAAIIAAYYFVGWRLAILLFPALYFSMLWLSRRRQMIAFARPAKDRNWTTIQKLRGSVFMVAIIGLPIYAVATDWLEIMRLWAPLIAAAILFRSKPEAMFPPRPDTQMREARIGAIATLGLLALAFVGASETFWFAAGPGLWIWFHAFSGLIGMAALIIAFFVVDKISSRRLLVPEQPHRIRGRPPPKENASDTNIYDALHWKHDGAVRSFKGVSIDQAVTMFERVNWRRELEKAPDSANHTPLFKVSFSDVEEMTIIPASADEITLRCCYLERDNNARVSAKPFRAEGIPIQLAPQILSLAWRASWPKLRRLLAAYETTGKLAGSRQSD